MNPVVMLTPLLLRPKIISRLFDFISKVCTPEKSEAFRTRFCNQEDTHVDMKFLLLSFRSRCLERFMRNHSDNIISDDEIINSVKEFFRKTFPAFDRAGWMVN